MYEINKDSSKIFMLLLVLLIVIALSSMLFNNIFMKGAVITILDKEDLGKVISSKTYEGFFVSRRTEIMTEKAGFTVGELITPAASNFELRHIKATNSGKIREWTEVCQSDNCFKPINLMLASKN